MTTQLSKQTLPGIRQKLQEALGPIARELGLVAELGNCKFTSGNCTFQLKLAVVGADGIVHTREREDFMRLCGRYTLEPEDFGRKFRTGGREFTICGLLPKCRRYPILATRDDGAQVKFNAIDVCRALSAED